MAETKFENPGFAPEKRIKLLYPVLLFWGLATAGLSVFYIVDNDLHLAAIRFYLIPWVLLTSLVVLAPGAYMLSRKKFDPFHPLILPVWTYLFPAFCIGGTVLAFGLAEPYLLSLVVDEQYNLPLALVYVMLGYIGLTVGFMLPFGRKIGHKISSKLPVWNWQAEQLGIPGVILFFIGLGYTILGFIQGLLGFQKVQEHGAFDGIIFLFSMFWLEASFILWLYIFRSKRFDALHYLIIGLLLFTSFTKFAFQGNRGSLIQIFILVSFAYVVSGRQLRFKHYFGGGILISLALIVGMIYGTTFRSIKQTEDQMSMDRYAMIVSETFEKLTDHDITVDLERGFAALAERIETVSSLGVIVSNYEKLRPYEESYGINDNIINEISSFFIPRVIWQDKPIAIEPSKYGDLYFNYSENAFAMTPMGDLLRNFGPVGVPLGMIVLGLIMRIIYSSLRENQEFSYWRATLFYMFLTSISFEGTYSAIIPMLFKVGIFSILGLLIVRIFISTPKRRI